VQLGGVWPIGDSRPVLVTALTTGSSTRLAPIDGVTVYTDVDMRLLVGDLLAKLRRHEQGRRCE
jgi:purine nucleosidase